LEEDEHMIYIYEFQFKYFNDGKCVAVSSQVGNLRPKKYAITISSMLCGGISFSNVLSILITSSSLYGSSVRSVQQKARNLAV